MHAIIALWCHPRSMSTAIERIMRARGDCTCFHEPFLYDYYVNRAVRPLPHFDEEQTKPVRYEDIRQSILDAARDQTVFIKDMSYYIVPGLFDDPDFSDLLTNVFLIRDPERSILSYFKLDPDVSLEEIGLEAQWRHFQWLEERGAHPFVIEAEAVQADPQGIIADFWQRVGLSHAPHAFEWQADSLPEDWKDVAGWHDNVSGSKGIAPPKPQKGGMTFADAVAKAPHLQDYLDHHRVFHEKLKAAAR